MHPFLLQLGSFKLPAYGLMASIGLLAGVLVNQLEAKRQGWDRDWMMNLSVGVAVAGILGSHLTYVLTRVGDPAVNLWRITVDLSSGFVYYGGLIAAWLTLVFFIRRKSYSSWDVMDSFAMAICVGLGLGRIGCLLGGCCYGTACALPWSVHMADHPELGGIHPVQAYEALYLFALFPLLWWRRSRKAYSGELVVWFVGSYAIARYVLELFRGDSIRGFLIQDILSTSQAISIPMLAVALGIWYLRRKSP